MGQKTHPVGVRLGITKTWNSKWFAKKSYAHYLHEDILIRKYIKQKLYHAAIPKIEIERVGTKIRVIIYTARPGIIIGKRGAEVDKLKKEIENQTSKQVSVDIKEVRKPEIDAQLVAENVALQLEKRVAFRRSMKKSMTSAMRFGALGIKISTSGRLAGAEIARTQWYREGRVPLHTFRANIDYGFAEARTTYGVIGVKVWIYKGEVLPESGKPIENE